MAKAVVIVIILLLLTAVGVGVYFAFQKHGKKSTTPQNTPGTDNNGNKCSSQGAGYQCPCGQYRGPDGKCHTPTASCTVNADCPNADDTCANNACIPSSQCLSGGMECGSASTCCFPGFVCAPLVDEMVDGFPSEARGVCIPVENASACDAQRKCPDGEVCVNIAGGPNTPAHSCVDPTTLGCESPLDCLAFLPNEPLVCTGVQGNGRCKIPSGPNNCALCTMSCTKDDDCCGDGLICSNGTCQCPTKAGSDCPRLCQWATKSDWILQSGDPGFCNKDVDCAQYTTPSDPEGSGPQPYKPQDTFCDVTTHACVYGCSPIKKLCGAGFTCVGAQGGGGLCYPNSAVGSAT